MLFLKIIYWYCFNSRTRLCKPPPYFLSEKCYAHPPPPNTRKSLRYLTICIFRLACTSEYGIFKIPLQAALLLQNPAPLSIISCPLNQIIVVMLSICVLICVTHISLIWLYSFFLSNRLVNNFDISCCMFVFILAIYVRFIDLSLFVCLKTCNPHIFCEVIFTNQIQCYM